MLTLDWLPPAHDQSADKYISEDTKRNILSFRSKTDVYVIDIILVNQCFRVFTTTIEKPTVPRRNREISQIRDHVVWMRVGPDWTCRYASQRSLRRNSRDETWMAQEDAWHWGISQDHRVPCWPQELYNHPASSVLFIYWYQDWNEISGSER